MGLNKFTLTKDRALPIFILADTSGSMVGEKIQAVNNAIREMIAALRNVTDIRGVFKVSVITFGGDQVDVQQKLTEVKSVDFHELTASGRTPLGQAIEVVTSLIEDREIVKSSDYLPTVVLLSDGYPTDFPGAETASYEQYLEWAPIKKMHEGKRSSKCLRVAINVEGGTDLNMLRAFLNNGTEPMMAADADGIAKLFKWITMSTISRMSSVNPNDIKSFLKFEDDEDDEVIV